MGILWIFECLHFLLHGDHGDISLDCLSLPELIFRAIGVINLARGLLIFYIFVCKNSILSKVSLCGWKLRPRSRGQPSHVKETSLNRYVGLSNEMWNSFYRNIWTCVETCRQSGKMKLWLPTLTTFPKILRLNFSWKMGSFRCQEHSSPFVLCDTHM